MYYVPEKTKLPTCLGHQVTQLFGTAGVKAKDVVVPNDALVTGPYHVDREIASGDYLGADCSAIGEVEAGAVQVGDRSRSSTGRR